MKKILLVSGETSGDQQGARLVNEIKQRDPNITFLGMGGDAMQAAGVEIVVHSKDLAVVGIVEVVAAFPRILKAFRQLKTCLKREKPELVILIDYPGFNLRFARTAKKAGCRVMYYIAPQLWAWGAGRIRWIQRYVDQVCVVFPFEADFYQKQGVNASFVGHPLTERVKTTLTRDAAFQHFQIIKDQHPIIGLLPGSRKSEIESLLPVLLESARLLKAQYPNAQFILPAAPHLNKAELLEKIHLYPELNIYLTDRSFYDAVALCDLAVAASGTVTLECGLLEVPTVLIYKLNPLTYWIAKKIAQQSSLGICNIITQEPVMKELIQENASPDRIYQEVVTLLEDPEALKKAQLALKKVKTALESPEKRLDASECIIRLLS